MSRSKLMWKILVNLVLSVMLFSSVGYGIIQISSIEELQKIGNEPGYPLDGEYELTQDIDASDTVNWGNGAGFVPIGTQDNPFIGKLDGKGHKITGLYIKSPEHSCGGLFYFVGEGGEVRNIGLENVIISVFNWGTIGGLVGVNSGTVSGSYVTGTVSGCDWGTIGGLVGVNSGVVRDSYAMARVIGGSYNKIGGLIGYLNNGSVINAYSTGLVVFGSYSAGGFVGYADGSYSVTSSYWDVETSGISTSVVGEGKRTAEMQQPTTYEGWDFTNVWGIVEGVSYPYLLWQGGPLIIVPDVVGFSLSEAESTITGAGLGVGVVSWQCDDVVPDGVVINQDPSGGLQVPPGTAVNLVVSTGPCFVPVPDVVGMSLSEAESTITGSGLSVGVVSEQCDDMVPEGNIISQSPTGGGFLPIGSLVDLVVSQGPCFEGTPEGEGVMEGTPEGEGITEGMPEGVVEGEGEWEVPSRHSADQNDDRQINLIELLRVIQFFNLGGYHCAGNEPTEDGYLAGYDGDKTCRPHTSDYNPRDWMINLSELLRLIQFFNMGGYHPCSEDPESEDGYCPGQLP